MFTEDKNKTQICTGNCDFSKVLFIPHINYVLSMLKSTRSLVKFENYME